MGKNPLKLLSLRGLMCMNFKKKTLMCMSFTAKFFKKKNISTHHKCKYILHKLLV